MESLCHWTFQNDYCEKRDTCSIYLSIYMFLSLECCSISSSVGFFSMSTVFGPCRQSCLSANSNMCTHTSYMRRHVCSKVNSDSLYNQTHVKHWALGVWETFKKSLLKSPFETSCSLAPVTVQDISILFKWHSHYIRGKSLNLIWDTQKNGLPENLFVQNKQMTYHMEVKWHTQITLKHFFAIF